MTGAGGHGASGATERLWRIAVLTAAGAIGTASHAEAALYYWSDSDSGYSRPGPTVPNARQKPRHHQAKKTEALEKESSKPQGPLIIAISIERQKLRIYDANGFFAETPISTGMKGHSTPMGVFSVIQKQKLHHSNIYSGAPMPYMQRITWSGIAIHAGVLPGYPASHGCIRMPMAFAIKMWNWTRMGARVVVTPGEMTPSSFSHPLLAAQKVVPQPTAANEPQVDAPLAARSDKASDADATIKPAASEANLELRSTVGHSDGVKSAIDQPPASAALRDQTHTADASSDMPADKASVTMSDASGGDASPRDKASAATDSSAGDASTAQVKSEDAAKPEAEPAAGKPSETVSSEDKPVETKSSEAKAPEIKSAASDKDGKKADEAEAAMPASGDAAKAEASSTGSVTAEAKIDEKKADAKKLDTRAEEIKAEASKPDAPKTNDKPNASATAVTDSSTSAPVKKDPARLPDADKPTAAKPDPAVTAPKRAGQIAVFISRKDAKLYARQNFAPLFDVPVTIAPSDRPLGTHVFTAQVDKDNANVLHWSVVSLPVPTRYAERRDEDDRASRRRRIAGAVEMKPMPVPDSPAEALDRLTIPADTMARITDALSTGASIIVSDQGINAGETGEGTDFIVSLR
jgi:lipoprotein-anchoring transpeptidase ErfK/SrfK